MNYKSVCWLELYVMCNYYSLVLLGYLCFLFVFFSL